MNRWSAVVALSCSIAVHGQWSVSRSEQGRTLQGERANLVQVEAWFDYNANSLRNELVAGLWKGSYLDRDLRERSRATMGNRNSVGYALGGRATWLGATGIEGHEQWRSLMSVAYHEQMGMRFTRDLYALSFFGNAGYEARRADLGPTAVERIRYQTIGVGMQHAHSNSYARVDFVIGQSYDAADVQWAGLYTGVDGRVLRASVLADYQRSDTASSRFGQVNGFGLAISGRWETELHRCMEGARFSLEVEDFGFANWTKTSQRLKKDTILEYDGIRVASILDLDYVIIGEDQLLDTFGLRYDQGAFTTWLPFALRAHLRMPLTEVWTWSATLEQRKLPGYVPQLLFAGERNFGDRTQVGACLGFGGFGGLRLGAMVRHRLGERSLLELSSPHLPGLVSGAARGAGLQFGIQYAF